MVTDDVVPGLLQFPNGNAQLAGRIKNGSGPRFVWLSAGSGDDGHQDRLIEVTKHLPHQQKFPRLPTPGSDSLPW
jgi:hypothetical protein